MQWTEISRDEMQIPGERYMPGTPYFRWESIFNEPQSMLQGKPVHDLKEVVEIRFPANPQYKPVFGTDEQCTLDANGRVITWAERYKSQYQAFLAGAEQMAEGTPLEELLPFGISQAQLSMCRALNIYSVEQLDQLEGPAVKKLGAHGNELKPMAARYIQSRREGRTQQSEIDALKRQLAELTEQKGLGSEVTVSTELSDEEIELPSGYETMTDAQLKDEIALLNDGKKPQGNPSRPTLETMLKTLQEAKAA